MMHSLCPAQQRALDGLLADQSLGHLFVLGGRPGMGKSTVLRQAHAALGGAFLTMKEFVDAMRPRHPLALEETFEHWLGEQLEANDRVFLDDEDIIEQVTAGCGAYPRVGFLRAALNAVVARVLSQNRKLILGASSHLSAEIQERSFDHWINEFHPEDYEHICRSYLGDRLSASLDYAKVHRFAPHLNAHQLKWVSVSRAHDEHLDTDTFIEFLRSRHLVSNVDLSEVQPVSLDDLKGIGDVLRDLEAHVIVPLERDDLAAELQLKPNRGVLLLGPPGTGKTTIGRALAHRLKSKFFLIDGTVISGSQNFYWQVHNIFEAAKRNAPAILFVDDSDVMFESGEELGLYRYLLTMLDGLESASAGRVCVMLAAVDIAHLPPALIRSGRIELWLELRLPDESARREILDDCLTPLAPELRRQVDLGKAAQATEGFTGADLKRLVEDAKNALAYDRVQARPVQPLLTYLLTAADQLRVNKQKYTEAGTAARQQRPARPVYFS